MKSRVHGFGRARTHYLLSILWNVVLEMPFIFGTSVELWDIADVTFTYMLTLKKVNKNSE